MESYKQRLENFNNSPIYQEELSLLYDLVNPTNGDIIIDVGCGIGTAINYIEWQCPHEIQLFGYDIVNHAPEHSWYFTDTIPDKFNKAYFMHSFAHIERIEKLLTDIWTIVDEVVIITPNRSYLEKSKPLNYMPDPTVVKHYTLEEVDRMFYSLAYERVYAGYTGTKGNERILYKAKSQYQTKNW